ncbi:VCBS repeat-containing protein [Bradyrhizobium sp. WYCCWR 13023]|uniref:VCBS repeat-containing protein n=1 Tax=Bradyrhizobium zhengyangense TaxID=2911009 RepID=A0A9X1UB60_9BRAD|nr:NF038122 family metalloprotease [Bradyrhizobium zhengyangense]MCG2630721.1 VCBS repeat-containing protein [Bradyrhizobium zhengyangense]
MILKSTLDEVSDNSFYTIVGDRIQGSYIPAASAGSASGGTTTGSVLSVTAGGIIINLVLDAAAQAAPASFKSGLQQAVAILAANITDKITVNINIDYSGTGGGAAAGPDSGLYENYSWVHSELVNHASPGDTAFDSLPSGAAIQGQSNVAVWNAQLKLWGVIGANDTTTDDASAYFSTDINSNLLVGVALHELTHAMGRVPYGSAPDVFDFYRFTSPGVHLFSGAQTAPAAYFSLDGGNIKLADYGQSSDPSDFLNSGVQGSNDPFNEYYTGSTSQQLSAVDLKQLDALGFHLTTSTSLTSNNLEPAGSGWVAAIKQDFNGDGHDDILWLQPSTGDGKIAYLSDGTVTSWTQFSTPGQGWVAIGHGDYNHDGNTDILWQNQSTGQAEESLLSAGQITATFSFGVMDPAWQLISSGDFNGDGTDDMLWRNTATGEGMEWFLQNGYATSWMKFGVMTPSWKVASTVDLNHDGTTDILWQNTSTGEGIEWFCNNGFAVAWQKFGTIGPGWDVVATADFNADGRVDLLWQNQTSGRLVEWFVNDQGLAFDWKDLGTPSDARWKVAGILDLHAANGPTILMQNAATGITTEISSTLAGAAYSLASPSAPSSAVQSSVASGQSSAVGASAVNSATSQNLADGHLESISSSQGHDIVAHPAHHDFMLL